MEYKDFDLQEAMERVDNDTELLVELILICRDLVPEQVRSMQGSTDLIHIREVAHSLKSSLGNVAAKKAYQAALKLEHAARDGRTQEIAGLLAELDAACFGFFESSAAILKV